VYAEVPWHLREQLDHLEKYRGAAYLMSDARQDV
jgi:hypothetical protein